MGKINFFSRRSNPFLTVGLKQAGLLASLLLIVGLTGFDRLLIGCITGPAVPLLLRLPSANKQFLLLSVCGIILHWVILGILAARMAAPTGKESEDDIIPWRLILGNLICLAMLSSFLTFALWPKTNRRVSGQNMVINNLRQIDGAKEQLVLEKRLESGHVITEADLSPYLKKGAENQLVPHYGTERYILNPIGTNPYAVLEADWWQPTRDLKLRRLAGTNGTIYRLP